MSSFFLFFNQCHCFLIFLVEILIWYKIQLQTVISLQVLCIDEATASIDAETDQFIQERIKEEFHSSTVLTIAHRTNTILNYDRVLVMCEGHVAEFDQPNKLLQDNESLFYKLVHGNK